MTSPEERIFVKRMVTKVVLVGIASHIIYKTVIWAKIDVKMNKILAAANPEES